MNKRIFISTHAELVGKIYGNDRRGMFGLLNSMFVDDNNINISPFSTSKTLFFNSDHLFVSKLIDASIILIIDSIDVITLRSYNISDNDYLLHHHTVNAKVQDLFDINKRKKGTHSSEVDQFYRLVFDIILDSEISFNHKADEIIDSIFKSKKEQNLERIKSDFLKSIYDGKRPKEIKFPDQVNQNDVISELLKYFDENPSNENDRKIVSPKTDEQLFLSLIHI